MAKVIQNYIEELPLERFLDIFEKPGKKYNFLVRGGEGLKAALFTLFQSVWMTEILPEGWTDSTIIHVTKYNEPDIYDPASLRHIHNKLDIFKFF